MPNRYLSQFGMFVMAILTGLVINATFLLIPKSVASKDVQIANLANSQYQFCTQPEPKNWQQGAGACFIFTKENSFIDGYYGYPHSDTFICIKGQIKGNTVTGKALAISLPMSQWSTIPKSEFTWDTEKRLVVSQGEIVRTSEGEWGRVDWIVFHKSTLNVGGLYQYSRPKMTPPSQLCDWSFEKN